MRSGQSFAHFSWGGKKMDPMPGPDAVGNWLRRMGAAGQAEDSQALRQVNDRLVARYVSSAEASPDSEAEQENSLVLDVDATIIESDKGDAKRAYDRTVGYHPMLAFLSDGRRRPCCSYVKFRSGNASAQADIREATRHTLNLLARQEGRSLDSFLSARSMARGYP